MAERPGIVLYCEDSGHEQFARALLGRVAKELGLRPHIRTLSGIGGHGRALTEFKIEMEYAPDLVAAMDLFRAGRSQPSLKHFIDEIRGALQNLS